MIAHVTLLSDCGVLIERPVQSQADWAITATLTDTGLDIPLGYFNDHDRSSRQ